MFDPTPLHASATAILAAHHEARDSVQQPGIWDRFVDKITDRISAVIGFFKKNNIVMVSPEEIRQQYLPPDVPRDWLPAENSRLWEMRHEELVKGSTMGSLIWDIKKNGIKNPVVLHISNGNKWITDGGHRVVVASILDINVPCILEYS